MGTGWGMVGPVQGAAQLDSPVGDRVEHAGPELRPFVRLVPERRGGPHDQPPGVGGRDGGTAWNLQRKERR